MNRCLRSDHTPASAWRPAFLVTTLVFANLAFAQEAVRPFPATARRATMQITYPPDILLNGQAARLSPGARIRGTNNLLVLSGTLAGQNVPVNYVRDQHGLVHEVWILNASEIRQPMDGATVPSNYVSDPAMASGEAGASTSAK